MIKKKKNQKVYNSKKQQHKVAKCFVKCDTVHLIVFSVHQLFTDLKENVSTEYSAQTDGKWCFFV